MKEHCLLLFLKHLQSNYYKKTSISNMKIITKRLASLTGKASKDLPIGLVASFLDKSESRIRIRLGLSAMGATSPDWVDIEHTKAKEKFRPQESNPRDTCNYCKEEGHWKFNCPKLEKKNDVGVYDETQEWRNSSIGRYWKVLIENQTRRKIKRLCIDNGLEFCLREFDDFVEMNE
ncbi:retrovirus-related pol polyprotein from transposon TNT 1-94 [Tanacetum coccineum]